MCRDPAIQYSAHGRDSRADTAGSDRLGGTRGEEGAAGSVPLTESTRKTAGGSARPHRFPAPQRSGRCAPRRVRRTGVTALLLLLLREHGSPRAGAPAAAARALCAVGWKQSPWAPFLRKEKAPSPYTPQINQVQIFPETDNASKQRTALPLPHLPPPIRLNDTELLAARPSPSAPPPSPPILPLHNPPLSPSPLRSVTRRSPAVLRCPFPRGPAQWPHSAQRPPPPARPPLNFLSGPESDAADTRVVHSNKFIFSIGSYGITTQIKLQSNYHIKRYPYYLTTVHSFISF